MRVSQRGAFQLQPSRTAIIGVRFDSIKERLADVARPLTCPIQLHGG